MADASKFLDEVDNLIVLIKQSEIEVRELQRKQNALNEAKKKVANILLQDDKYYYVTHQGEVWLVEFDNGRNYATVTPIEQYEP